MTEDYHHTRKTRSFQREGRVYPLCRLCHGAGQCSCSPLNYPEIQRWRQEKRERGSGKREKAWQEKTENACPYSHGRSFTRTFLMQPRREERRTRRFSVIDVHEWGNCKAHTAHAQNHKHHQHPNATWSHHDKLFCQVWHGSRSDQGLF